MIEISQDPHKNGKQKFLKLTKCVWHQDLPEKPFKIFFEPIRTFYNFLLQKSLYKKFLCKIGQVTECNTNKQKTMFDGLLTYMLYIECNTDLVDPSQPFLKM